MKLIAGTLTLLHLLMALETFPVVLAETLTCHACNGYDYSCRPDPNHPLVNCTPTNSPDKQCLRIESFNDISTDICAFKSAGVENFNNCTRGDACRCFIEACNRNEIGGSHTTPPNRGKSTASSSIVHSKIIISGYTFFLQFIYFSFQVGTGS